MVCSPTGAPGGGWRVGGQPRDSPVLQSRQGGARGAGAGAGGREVHLCGAPSGLRSSGSVCGSTCRCAVGGGRGGVTEIQYWQ